MTNNAKSIRARLLNIARAENKTFQLILIRYFHERFLYRLSISQFCRNFILKGGTLLYIYSREKTRPTKDIDFLGLNIPNQTISIKKVFTEICSIDYPYDAVKFYVESIMVEEIADHEEYQGIRLLIDASLDTAIQKLQIDVGFGDIMIPDPVDLKYPVFFPDLYSPIIRAYSPETVIAEKFEAMIDLSVINSRMKDFYDVYQILTTKQIDPESLLQSVQSTFRNRHTTYSQEHSIFSHEFSKDPVRLAQWKAFLHKNRLNEALDFSLVMETIITAMPKSI